MDLKLKNKVFIVTGGGAGTCCGGATRTSAALSTRSSSSRLTTGMRECRGGAGACAGHARLLALLVTGRGEAMALDLAACPSIPGDCRLCCARRGSRVCR